VRGEAHAARGGQRSRQFKSVVVSETATGATEVIAHDQDAVPEHGPRTRLNGHCADDHLAPATASQEGDDTPVHTRLGRHMPTRQLGNVAGPPTEGACSRVQRRQAIGLQQLDTGDALRVPADDQIVLHRDTEDRQREKRHVGATTTRSVINHHRHEPDAPDIAPAVSRVAPDGESCVHEDRFTRYGGQADRSGKRRPVGIPHRPVDAQPFGG